MLKQKQTKWKNSAYDPVSVLDDDGEISTEDLKKIREFINEYAKNSETINPIKKAAHGK